MYGQTNIYFFLLSVCGQLLVQVEARRSRQVVTDAERDYAMSGNFDQLIEEQRRIDEERDAEVVKLVCG